MSFRLAFHSLIAVVVSATATPAQTPGIEFVPTTSFAFASVKVSDLWDAPSMKGARDTLMKPGLGFAPELQELIGVAPADVERVTLVMPSVNVNSASR